MLTERAASGLLHRTVDARTQQRGGASRKRLPVCRAARRDGHQRVRVPAQQHRLTETDSEKTLRPIRRVPRQNELTGGFHDSPQTTERVSCHPEGGGLKLAAARSVKPNRAP